jgi:hypothetical protein
MPVARIQMPDGRIGRFDVPEGMTPDQVLSFVGQSQPDIAQQDTPAQEAPQQQSGFFRGLKDPQQGITQLIGKGVETVLPSDSRIGQAVARVNENLRQMFSQDEQQYQASRPQDAGIDWARLGGNVAMTAPMAMATPAATTLPGAIGVGALSGAATGAMQPVLDQNYWGEKAQQAGIGALTGGATGSIMHGIGRMLAPQTDPAVKMLMDEGVTPTPGQIMGGAAKSMEEKARSLPLIGEKIAGAQTRGIEDFNRAAVTRVLAPLGQSLPEDMPVGRDALRFAKDAVSSAYDNALTGLKVGVDQQFGTDVNGLRSLAQNMVPERADQFDKILNNEVLRHFSNGQISGETMKKIESTLGSLAGKLKAGGNQDASMVGDAVLQLQQNLRDLVMRSNPQAADSLRSANQAFANLARVQTAGGGQGAEGGLFTPRQLSAAVRAGDRTVRKNAYGMGDALMQDLTDAGRSVLSPNVPDSGTAGRLMPWLTGGGFGALAIHSPGTAAMTAAGAGAASLPYTQTGGRLAAALLAGQRPASVEKVGELLKLLSPYAAAGGPSVYRAGQ